MTIMEFTDIEAAESRREKEEARYKDIYGDEVRVGSEILHFTRVSLSDGKFSVMLPDSYTDMPRDLAKLKYPHENRPTVIKTNEATTVNFAFALYDQDFSEAQVESATNGMKSGLARVTPGARFFDTVFTSTEDNVKFGCFDFLTTGLDMEMYQLFGFMPVQGKFLHVIFNAPAVMLRAWQPVAIQTLRSVKDIREA
jgi:hypothetical protein